MTSRRWSAILSLITLILVLAVSCGLAKGFDTPSRGRIAPHTPQKAATEAPASPSAIQLDLGDPVPLAAARIGSRGGRVEVSSPGNPLDGLTIEVPAGAFGGEVSLEVSSREVDDHSLREHFSPVSPLIEIRGGDGLADELLTLTIPIEISSDEFAMAFAYDAASAKLEGLALLESTSNSVKVATRDISRDVLVSAVLVDELYEGSDSGFEHGVDNWHFPNYGSYIAPGAIARARASRRCTTTSRGWDSRCTGCTTTTITNTRRHRTCGLTMSWATGWRL